MGTRNQITKTPGKIVFDAAGANLHLYSSSGISVELQEEVVTLSTNRDGTWDEVTTGRLVVVKMTPTQFTAGALAALFTHGALRKGASIIGSTDKTLDIHTVDGVRRRILCAFVYGEPALTAKVGSTILGEVTFYGVLGLNGDPTMGASYYHKTAVAFDDTTWNPDHELTPGWRFSWSTEDASDWDDIMTTGGVTITPSSTLDEDRCDRRGLLNVTIRDYGVEIAAQCLNISEDLALAATGFNGLALGRRRGTMGRLMKLRSTYSDAFIYCENAVLQPGYTFEMDAGQTVVSNLRWATRPRYTNGTLAAHLLVSATDPENEGGGGGP